jgi:hypothetical protein
MNSLVYIGECISPIESVIVHSLFDAYDIPVLISGENHVRMAVSFFWGPPISILRMRVFVHRSHGEEAAALFSSMRGSEHVAVDDHEPAGVASGDAERQRIATAALPAADTQRWSETALAVLLATVLGFGAAHLYYLQGWRRGAALAVVQLGVLSCASSLHLFVMLLGIARIADTLGALRAIWFASACDEANARNGGPATARELARP